MSKYFSVILLLHACSAVQIVYEMKQLLVTRSKIYTMFCPGGVLNIRSACEPNLYNYVMCGEKSNTDICGNTPQWTAYRSAILRSCNVGELDVVYYDHDDYYINIVVPEVQSLLSTKLVATVKYATANGVQGSEETSSWFMEDDHLYEIIPRSEILCPVPYLDPILLKPHYDTKDNLVLWLQYQLYYIRAVSGRIIKSSIKNNTLLTMPTTVRLSYYTDICEDDCTWNLDPNKDFLIDENTFFDIPYNLLPVQPRTNYTNIHYFDFRPVRTTKPIPTTTTNKSNQLSPSLIIIIIIFLQQRLYNF